MELEDGIDDETPQEAPKGWRHLLNFAKKPPPPIVDPVYSLAWSQPETQGVAPTPRQGHTMTLIGGDLYVFGGTDGKKTFDTLFVLSIDTMTWSKPQCIGVIPKPRHKHCAVALPNDVLFIWGGFGGGNDVYMYEIESRTWFKPRINGNQEPPSPRVSHSAALVGQAVFITGGHDGEKALDEVWSFNLESRTWALVEVGDTPELGNKHCITAIPNTDTFVVMGGSTFEHVSMFNAARLAWKHKPTTGDTLPPPRASHAAVAAESGVYMFGGVGGGAALNDLYVLGSRTLKWAFPNIAGVPPSPRMGHAMEVVSTRYGTKMFVLGGHSGLQPLNDLHVLVVLTWSTIDEQETTPSARLGASMNVFRDKVYIIGGAGDGEPFNDVRIFIPATSTWEIPRITGVPPKALVAHTSVVVGQELFVFGGGDGHGDGNTLVVYDIESSTWDDPVCEGVPPRARYGHAACYVDHRMFVFGGYSVKVGYSNSIAVLDTETMAWTSPYINGIAPAHRVGHTLSVFGKDIVLYGGSQGSEIFGDMHFLDTVTMTWTQPQQDERVPAPLPRYNHSGVAIGSRLFVYGGLVSPQQAGAGRPKRWRRHGLNLVTDEFFMIDITQMRWEKPVVSGPSPGCRFRQSAGVWNTQLLMFGGHGGGAEMWVMETGVKAGFEKSAPRKKKHKYQQELDDNIEGDSVLDWLRLHGLEKYARAFVKAEIDWESILELNDEDLKQMGITALGPRKKLLAKIGEKRMTMENDDTLDTSSEIYQRRYRLDGVGELGTSAVKVATDLKTGRQVALKFVSDKSSFRNEVQMLRDLRSEFVVDLIDFYEDSQNNQNCLVLELGSTDMQKYIRQNPIERNERRFLIDRMARILEHLHSRNIVHGDFKPGNICLFGLKWKVIDLATARHMGEEVAPAVTPLYCSPETAKAIGKKQMDRLRANPAMDMWALGVVMVELFVRKPFCRSDRPDIMSSLQSFSEIDFPSTIDDEQAKHLLGKLLRKSALDRANISYVLRHAFLVGGMDTEQITRNFEFLQTTQLTLTQRLTTLQQQLDKQLKNEKGYLDQAREQQRIKAELEAEDGGGAMELLSSAAGLFRTNED